MPSTLVDGDTPALDFYNHIMNGVTEVMPSLKMIMSDVDYSKPWAMLAINPAGRHA